MAPPKPFACIRCTEPALRDSAYCQPCARAPRPRRSFLSELSEYWERRLVEGREKDWT